MLLQLRRARGMITTKASGDPEITHRWLERVAAGDPAGWRWLVEEHHARLRRMVALRLDPRLQGRVDPSDVLQDTYLQAAEHLPGYLQNPSVPFFLWLRSLAAGRLSKLHRYHLGAQMCAARGIGVTPGKLASVPPFPP